MYTMLEQRVLILASRRIVQKYDDTMDGRQALLDLVDQARHSTEAVLSGRHTREMTIILFSEGRICDVMRYSYHDVTRNVFECSARLVTRYSHRDVIWVEYSYCE